MQTVMEEPIPSHPFACKGRKVWTGHHPTEDMAPSPRGWLQGWAARLWEETGPRSQLLWVHGSSLRASLWGRHHCSDGDACPTDKAGGDKGAQCQQEVAHGLFKWPGAEAAGTQATKGHSHVWAKGSASEGHPRLQCSAFEGSNAQAHTILLRPRARTGLPVLGRNHPTNAENRAGMGDWTRAATRLRDRHVCLSRKGQARAPHSALGALAAGDRSPSCRPHLSQPLRCLPTPHQWDKGAGHQEQPPENGAGGGPAAGRRRGLAGERTEGQWGSGDRPAAAGPTGRRADPCTASPSPRSSRCCQDPGWPDHAGDPRPRLDLQGGERPAQQSGCCVPTTLRGSQRTRTSHPGGTAAGGGPRGVHRASLETPFHRQGGPHDASWASAKPPSRGRVGAERDSASTDARAILGPLSATVGHQAQVLGGASSSRTHRPPYPGAQNTQHRQEQL